MHLRAWLGAFRGFRASGLRVEGILCSVNGLLVYRASGHDDDDDNDDKINDDTGDDEGQEEEEEEEEDDDTHSNDGDADDGNDET